MIIEVVTFIVPADSKEQFQEKFDRDAAAGLPPGCISQEIWVDEKAEEIEYVYVSKWNDKKDFQNWLSRPEHAQGHQEKNQYYKDHPEIERPKIVKKSKSYKLYK